MQTVLCPSIVKCDEILEDGPDRGPRQLRPGSYMRTLGVCTKVVIRLPYNFEAVQVGQAIMWSFEDQMLIQ